LALQRRYTEALQAFADNQPQQSLSLCEAILRDAPGHAPTLALAERVHTQLAGRPTLTPQQEEDVRRLYLAGLERFTAGEYAAAVLEWEKILAIDPGNPGALGNIREARSRMQRLDTADGSQE
jgi:cytochrome c-type biogenesis protein CcmH/NrfG